MIGRVLFYDSIDTLNSIRLDYNTGFIIAGKNGTYGTSLGTNGSDILVTKKNDGIDIKVLDYDKPAAQRDFKVYKSVTYKEIKEKISKDDLDKINKVIEEYKKTKKYQEGNKIDD